MKSKFKIKMIREDIESTGEANVVIESDGLVINGNKLYFKNNLWSIFGAYHSGDDLIEMLKFVFEIFVEDEQCVCIKVKDLLGDLIIGIDVENERDVNDIGEGVEFDVEKLIGLEF